MRLCSASTETVPHMERNGTVKLLRALIQLREAGGAIPLAYSPALWVEPRRYSAEFRSH